jgi:hypothetical protein
MTSLPGIHDSGAMNEGAKILYWHRELPPLDAEVMGEYVAEATMSVSGERSLIATRCGIVAMMIS